MNIFFFLTFINLTDSELKTLNIILKKPDEILKLFFTVIDKEKFTKEASALKNYCIGLDDFKAISDATTVKQFEKFTTNIIKILLKKIENEYSDLLINDTNFEDILAFVPFLKNNANDHVCFSNKNRDCNFNYQVFLIDMHGVIANISAAFLINLKKNRKNLEKHAAIVLQLHTLIGFLVTKYTNISTSLIKDIRPCSLFSYNKLTFNVFFYLILCDIIFEIYGCFNLNRLLVVYNSMKITRYLKDTENAKVNIKNRFKKDDCKCICELKSIEKNV